MGNYKIKDKRLYDATKKFTYLVGGMLEKDVKSGRIPEYIKLAFQIVGDLSSLEGDKQLYLIKRSPYYEFFYKNIGELEASGEFRTLVSIIDKNETIKSHLDKYVGTAEYKSLISLRHSFLTSTVLPVLTKSDIIQSGVFTFNDEVFDNAYIKNEQFFYSKDLQFKERVIIYNFKLDSEEILLDNGIQIRKLLEEEQKDFDIYHYDLFLNHLVTQNAGLCEIYKIFETKKVIDSSMQLKFHRSSEEQKQRNDILKQVLTTIEALELFTRGSIGRLFVDSVPLNNPFWEYNIPSTYNFHGDWVDKEKIYQFKTSEVRLFNDFLKLYERAKTFNEFNVALSRLKAGRMREDPIDRIIDDVIAFDSILGGGGRAIAQRAAVLITNNEKTQGKIVNILHQAYEKFRSKILHGGEAEKITIDGEEVNQVELADLTQELLRISLKCYMALKVSNSEKNIRQLLDNALFDSDIANNVRKIAGPYLKNEIYFNQEAL